jgi:hypothetical protein
MRPCILASSLFDRGFSAAGEFRLIGAHLAANLTLENGAFDNPGGVALNLERIVAAAVNGDGLTCRGHASMIGARVSGDVNLARAVLESGAGTCALNAERAQVDGTLVLRDAKALGEVNLRSVKVGERLLLERAELRNPPGMACRLSRARVTSDVFASRVTAAGRLRLAGAVIGAALNLQGAVLGNPGGKALDACNLIATCCTPGNGSSARAGDWQRSRGATSRTSRSATATGPRRARGWFALLLAIGGAVFSLAPRRTDAGGRSCWDPEEARKCRRIIATGHPGLVFIPIVIDRDNAPALADASPYLVLFNAVIGAIDLDAGEGRARVVSAIAGTAGAHFRSLCDIILGVASDAAREQLEQLMGIT